MPVRVLAPRTERRCRGRLVREELRSRSAGGLRGDLVPKSAVRQLRLLSTAPAVFARNRFNGYSGGMADPAKRLATYADLLDLPEDARAEIVGGLVMMNPAPLPRHSKTQRALGRFVGGPFDDDHDAGGPGGWWVFVEVDVRLALNDVVRPDLAGWRRGRLSDPGDQRPIEVVPDWVCEILSPSTTALDRGAKRELYARAGVRHYWIADPLARMIETFELRDGAWVLMGSPVAGDIACLAPFEAVELELERLFLPEPSGEA